MRASEHMPCTAQRIYYPGTPILYREVSENGLPNCKQISNFKVLVFGLRLSAAAQHMSSGQPALKVDSWVIWPYGSNIGTPPLKHVYLGCIKAVLPQILRVGSS